MMHSKMVDNYELIDLGNCEWIDFDSSPHPSDQEIEILLESLKPEMPPLIDSLQLCDYVNQLLAEIYQDKLLKGKILSFTVCNLIGELKGNNYMKFEGNGGLYRVYQIMYKVITHCCLDLEFENCDDEGLLLYNYEPDDLGEIGVALKINGNKIECK